MDTSEKINVFKSFEELTQEIIRDKESHDMLAQRYAVRFIMLNNFNEFKELAKFMANIGVQSLDLENLIDDGEDDTWITKDMLKNAIKACIVPTFVTPFSEVARFYNDEDFRGFFNEIILLEDIHHPTKRIYIPLIGLQNRFTDFLNHFARLQESAPIWRYDAEPQSVEVFFAKYKDFVLPNESVQCQLDSLRDWLMFWKKQAPQERIVCTSAPIAAKYKYSKPDNIFNFTRIANAYEFMTQFLELRFPFVYDEEEKYWEQFRTFQGRLYATKTRTCQDMIQEGHAWIKGILRADLWMRHIQEGEWRWNVFSVEPSRRVFYFKLWKKRRFHRQQKLQRTVKIMQSSGALFQKRKELRCLALLLHTHKS